MDSGNKSALVSIVTALLGSVTTISTAVIGSQHLSQTAKAASAQIANQNAILGEIRAFATEAQPPPGWEECAGQSEEIDGRYSALYKIIGKAWGSADAAHFNLPDLRGMFLRGWNDGKGKGDQGDADPSITGTLWFDVNQRYSLHKNGASGDHVGSYEGDAVGRHSHFLANGVAIHTTGEPTNNEFTSNSGWDDHSAHNTDPDKDQKLSLLSAESIPKNAAVMFAIYVGPTK